MSELVDLERIEFSGARDGDVVDPDYIRNTRLQVVSQVAIRFMPANRVVYCDAGTMIVRARDRVIVETDKGTLTGTVVTPAHRALREARLNRRLVRFASDDDERNVQRHQFKQAESFQFCLQRIRARNLPMKLVSVKYLHAGNKAIFYFSAEGRIDFRELVRDLAQRFRVRIEMRQIGIRDEAKIIGGVGPCGQQTCCSRYLQNFSPVTIKMAKTQNLVLNPQKVSGICGRLMCCLAYENEVYEELRKELPSMNERVRTSIGEGVVKGVMIIGKRVKVLHDNGEMQDFHIGDVECLGRAPRRSRTSRGEGEDAQPTESEARTAPGPRTSPETRAASDSRRTRTPRPEAAPKTGPEPDASEEADEAFEGEGPDSVDGGSGSLDGENETGEDGKPKRRRSSRGRRRRRRGGKKPDGTESSE